MGRWLQNFRRVFAGCFFLLLVLYTCGMTSTLFGYDLSILTKVQLVPALLAGSFIVVCSVFVFTFLFGRWYCSFLCPLGIFQDILGRLKKGTSLKDSRSRTITRYCVLLLCVTSLFFGATFILLLVDPWSIFSRVATTFMLPPLTFFNNLIFELLHHFGLYGVAAKEYNFAGISVLFTAILSLLLLFYLLFFKGGRSWCNTICPVGTIFSLVGIKPVVRIRISRARCVHCGRCETECKAGVIDMKSGLIHSGDCVACFNCLPVCKDNAISYGFSKEEMLR